MARAWTGCIMRGTFGARPAANCRLLPPVHRSFIAVHVGRLFYWWIARLTRYAARSAKTRHGAARASCVLLLLVRRGEPVTPRSARRRLSLVQQRERYGGYISFEGWKTILASCLNWWI